ncbi:MAG: FAD-dependent oxidoreductase [Promethearchaeati archaeon SRVP18_Atabeyarchaeia-1]
MKIVVIGAGAAGTSAALETRKVNREAEVTVINSEEYPEYSRCGLPYAVSGHIPKFENLILHDEGWYDKFGKVKLMLRSEVTEIVPSSNLVKVRHEGGAEEELQYDSLIIATGSKPSSPPILGLNKKGILSLRTIGDGKNIMTAGARGKKAIVVGAGLIGLELAEALHARGAHVTVIEFLPNVLLAMVDEDIADVVRKKIEEAGVKLLLNTKVDEAIGQDRVQGVVATNRQTNQKITVEADILVLAAGIKPDTTLAEKSGVALGPAKAIKVDEHMRTNIKGIYSAGECTEYLDFITGTPVRVGLGTIAVRQGKVAGINAAGGNATMEPLLNTRVTELFGLEIAGVGPLSEAATKAGIKLITGKFRGSTLPEYMPDGKEIVVKVLANEQGKIVGAQIVGEEQVAQRINVFAAAILKGTTVEEFSMLETCYAPPIAPTWDSITIAAESVAKKLKRR